MVTAKGWDRALLVEGDNLLFAPLTTSRVAALSAEYTGVALCPQSNLYVTASVMWVASHRALGKMLTRIIDILENPGRFYTFLFLRGNNCLRHGSQSTLQRVLGRLTPNISSILPVAAACRELGALELNGHDCPNGHWDLTPERVGPNS